MTCFVDSDAKIIIFSKNMFNSRFDMKEMRLVDVILGIKLIRIKESVSQVEYSRVIGNLMYLMSCTRPDIAYLVSKLSSYTSNPEAKH